MNATGAPLLAQFEAVVTQQPSKADLRAICRDAHTEHRRNGSAQVSPSRTRGLAPNVRRKIDVGAGARSPPPWEDSCSIWADFTATSTPNAVSGDDKRVPATTNAPVAHTALLVPEETLLVEDPSDRD